MKVDTGIILAGGRSRRMGFDKQEIKIDGKLIVDYQAEILQRHFSQIIVVTRTPDIYRDVGYTLCQDYYEGLGPLAGIHAGLKGAESQGSFVIACDMPNINDGYISYIVQIFENSNALGLVAAHDGFIEPMAGIYSRDLIPILEEKLENRDLKIQSLIEENDFIKISKDQVEKFDPDLKIFQNLNYQEDLKNLK